MTMPKGKRDILGDMLTGQETSSSFPEIDQLTKIIYCTGKGAPGSEGPGRRRREKKNKKKMTHYLSLETCENLDASLSKIKDLVPDDYRRQVSKSLLIESGVELLLHEFEKKGEQSLVLKRFLNGKDKTSP